MSASLCSIATGQVALCARKTATATSFQTQELAAKTCIFTQRPRALNAIAWVSYVKREHVKMRSNVM